MNKESETVEFKESLTQLKKGIISIASILNKHKKGKIVFGMKDDGIVKGISIGKSTLRDISKTISDQIEPKIYPQIKEEIIRGKKCVVINFEGDNTPYFAYGRAYKRIADEDRPLSKSELEKLILEKNKDKIVWDSQTNKQFTLADISKEKILLFTKSIGLSFTTKEDVLKKLNLIKQKKLVNSSILFFGKNPSTYFKLLNLRCAVFPGVDKSSEPIDMTDFEGDLFQLIEEAEKYILKNINVGMKLEGLKRVDVPEISKDAIREAIINAFCHRDYYIPQEIQIAIFKNRLEILNPGKLYANLTIKDILTKPVSERRNPLIADVFHKVHYVEKWGTGIGKIRKLEPKTKFEELTNSFVVIFKRKAPAYVPKKDKIEKFRITKDQLRDKELPKQVLLDWLGEGWEKVGRRLGVSQLKIIILIFENKEITIAELSSALDLSTTAIENNLKKLKEAGLLERVGGDKEGSWKVLE